MEINTWSRQVVLTNAFTGRLCSSLSILSLFFSALIYSLSSYKVCLISKGVIPLLLHLWCIMQSDWTQSLKELSAIILGVCVCVYVSMFIWQKVNYFSVNIWNCATCYRVSTDGWKSLQSILLNTISSLVVLCFVCGSFDVQGQPLQE